MCEFLLYIGRSSLYLAIFYAFFLLVMRRTSLFRFNRIALLAGSAACFVLPLVRLRTVVSAAPVAGAVAGPVEAVAAGAPEPLAAAASAGSSWLLLLYVAGAAAVFVLTGLSALRLIRLIRAGHTTREDGYSLTLVDGDIPSFSWGRHIVMSRADLESSPAILTHERMHVKKLHSFDNALFFVVTVFHWFNPLVWITLSELKLLHEYEADEAVIQNGIDATQYQLLLVKKAVGENRFSLANGFQHSKLKNRINMMLKKQTSGWMRFAYLLLLPVLAGAMFACNPAREQDGDLVLDEEQLETKAADETVPFQLVEVKPTFNGGDANKFSEWVNSQLKYPEAAKEASAQGRVILQFTVGADGKVGNVSVLRGAHEALDAEALRVVSASPDWTPGERDGKAVPVTYTFPVVFRLSGDDSGNNASTSGESAPQDFAAIEVKPTFNGGDANEFSKWVNSHLKYPDAAKAAGDQGRVLISFVVGSDGSVSDVKLLRGVSDELDAEALRVIKSSPKWEPGRQDGKAVPVTYTFPVTFKLK